MQPTDQMSMLNGIFDELKQKINEYVLRPKILMIACTSKQIHCFQTKTLGTKSKKVLSNFLFDFKHTLYCIYIGEEVLVNDTTK